MVRHLLVARIVTAYEAHTRAQASREGQAGDGLPAPQPVGAIRLQHGRATLAGRSAALGAAALAGGGQVTVRYVAAEEGRQLNRDYRGKDYATNVLSFVI